MPIELTDEQPRLCRSFIHWCPENVALAHKGECRRHPPMIDGWPVSKSGDGCGEWKLKTDTAE